MMQHQVTLGPAAGARIEFRPRVFSFSFHVPHLHAGGDWRAVPLARWYFLMLARLVLKRTGPVQRASGLGSAGAGTSAGKPSGLPF